MNSKIIQLLSQLIRNEAANAGAIATLVTASGMKLPRDYLEFFLYSNGASGFVGSSYLVLWPAEDVIRLNESYGTKEYTPEFLLFGSDGGGTGYGFDNRVDRVRIVDVPFIGISYEDAVVRGDTFEEFLEFLNVQWSELEA